MEEKYKTPTKECSSKGIKDMFSLLLSYFDCIFVLRMTTEKKNMAIVEFVSFCIERYKQLKNMSGKEVADLFQSLGVVNYLITNYEILHTQNADFIQEEIELFIKAQSV